MEEDELEAEKNKIKNFGLPLSDLTDREVKDIQEMKLNVNSVKANSKINREKVLSGSILHKNVTNKIYLFLVRN